MMDDRWQTFFETFPSTVTTEQLPVKLPRFDLDLSDLAGAAADWCHQYLKDRKCPCDLIVILTKIIINNLRIQWAAEPKSFGYRPETKDYQALWLMKRIIEELNEVCLDFTSNIPDRLLKPMLSSVWWSSFTLKNTRRQMEDYIAVVPYLHTLFDIKDFGEASFYAVYDGHNGLDAAVYSSMYLHQFLVQSEHYPTNPESALYEAFFTTDKGFTQKTEKYCLVSGTTAVCALYRPQEKKLYIGWAGDSIAMLWTNGTPLCLVNKHVPERRDETQRIESEGGMISKCQGIWRVFGQLAVSRAIGDVKYKPHVTCQPEMRTLVLDGNEEFLVLGSDGLWEDVTPEDIAEIIYDELLETDGDVSEVSNKLCFRSKAQGSTDNISVITVFLQDPKQLVAKRRAVIMETAMEQRNATLASYGQDTGDFGPETDVDTPDDQINLTKPLKVEGEANVIDESGEDSEEDGGGWNYYKKSDTEGEKKKEYQGEVDDQIAGTNFDAEDMDYKLNPDAPEFVPVSSPPANHAQRFLNMDSDDFISSSPQKYKESIENVDVPDENDFTNEIKVHAADLSKLNNPFEPNDDSTMLNGIKSLNEDVTEHDETEDNFVFQNEHINNHNSDEYQKPFYSGNKIDLDQVQDLTDLVDYDDEDEDTQNNTFKSDPFISIMETSKMNEFKSTSGNNELQNETDIKLHNDFSLGEHIKYEHDMNLKNADDTISTANATIGSTLQFDDTSFKHDEDLRNEFMEGNHIDKSAHYDSYNKLNDSVSTTGAVLGSEPNTPIRMDNQSTFESENDDDQFSESFKQQLQFNQFDENNDKENHDPFCFEQTEDPAGIIPNVVQEVNEVVHETHHDDTLISNDNSNDKQGSESIKHEPVDEPLCIKEKAKPIHSLYEQEYLPESEISVSNHEALLNATESVSNEHENNINTEQIIEKHNEIKQEYDGEYQKVDEHLNQDQYTLDNRDHYSPEPKDTDDVELEDSDVDEIKYHAEGLKQEFDNDDTSDFEAEQIGVNSVHNEIENISLEHNLVSDENKHIDDLNLEKHAADYIENQVDNFETMKPIEDININPAHNVTDDLQNFVKDSLQNNYDITAIQNSSENIEKENLSDSEIKSSEASEENLKLVDEFNRETLETIKNHEKDTNEVIHEHFENKIHEHVFVSDINDFEHEIEVISENAQNHVDDFQQEIDVISEIKQNHVDDFQQKIDFIPEVEHNLVNNFKQDNDVISEVGHNLVNDFKQENDVISEVGHNLVNNFKQENDVISENKHSPVDDIKEESHANFEVEDSLVNDSKQESHVISEVEDSLVNDSKQESHVISEVEDSLVNDSKQESHVISEVEDSLVNDFKQENPDISEVQHSPVGDLKQEHYNVVETENNFIKDIKQENNFDKVEHNHVEDFISEHNNTAEIAYNNINSKQESNDVDKIENNSIENLKQEYSVVSEFVQGHNDDFQEHHDVESVQNHTVDSDEEMHSSMIIHPDVENNIPQPYCSANDALLIKEPDMMCTSMTFEENFQNRNMSDSLYVMETSSDYFGEEIQPNTQLEKSVDEPKAEEQSSNIDNEHIESEKIQNQILTETKSELVSESKVEEVKEATEMNKLSSTDVVEKVDVQDDNSKVAEIAVAAAVGAAAVAAVTGVSLASKKSAPKKLETTVSKAKTTTTKTTSPKPLVSKSSTSILKKTTALSTTSKPLARPTTAPSTTSKPTANVRPTTAPKTTAIKSTTAPIKTAPKPPAKTSTTVSRLAPTKTTPTTARVSLTKTTPTASPKTPTSPKTASATKLTTTAKTSTTPRTSTSISKQPLTNGSPKPASRPISAPAKKTLSSPTTNGTTKLTNGDVSKVSSTTKPPISLATRMSLAPPKLPPKVKVAPKTAPPAAMPGPIRRPKAPITKKTETATS